jgi:DNA polymerase II large subunit
MQSENFDENNNDLDLHKLEYEYLSSAEALTLSKNYNIPLHPKYTYCYNDVTIEDLNALIELIEKGKKNYKPNNELILDLSYPKRVLEVIGVPHTVRDGKIVIDKDHAYALLVTLPKKLPEKDSTLEAVNEISPIEIKNKAPAYIGTRVGRPEKSKERLMRPAPHVLFPIGNNGGARRLIATAAKKGSIKVEIARRKCTNPSCGISSNNSLCPKCGSPTEIGKPSERSIPLASMLKKASDNVKVRRVDEVKGVVGMISESKLAEPLEKGILRAKNEVFTFKDGTIRHDSTDLPLTHFIPKEIGVTVEKLKEMGAKRALVLKVGGAFHSPLMQPAKEELEEAIMKTDFHTPACPVYQNVDGKAHTDAGEIKQNLIAQLTAPVRWTSEVNAMIADGATDFVECGPGKALQGMIAKIAKGNEAVTVSGI